MDKIVFDLDAITAELDKAFATHSGQFTVVQIDSALKISEFLHHQHMPAHPQTAVVILCKDQFTIAYVFGLDKVCVYNKHNAREKIAYVRQTTVGNNDPQQSVIVDAVRAAKALLTINEMMDKEGA